MIEKELNYFDQHKTELIAKYSGRYVVIVGEKVVGDYISENDAYIDSVEKYKLGDFLIKQCDTNIDTYSQTFHSRVYFA